MFSSISPGLHGELEIGWAKLQRNHILLCDELCSERKSHSLQNPDTFGEGHRFVIGAAQPTSAGMWSIPHWQRSRDRPNTSER